MATDGKDSAYIAKTLSIDAKVADRAVTEAAAHPLRVTSAEAAPYREIYASISGAKFVDRNGILGAYHAAAAERDAAEAAMKVADKELEAAEQGWRAQKDQAASVARTDAMLEYQARMADWNTAKSRLTKAEADYQPKFAAYLDLPEERQARAAQAALNKAGGPAP